MKRKDFLWSLAISIAWNLFLFLATEGTSLFGLKKYLGQFRGPTPKIWIPKVPFALAGLKILVFYIVLGAAMGTILAFVARVLASEPREGGGWAIPRRRYYVVFSAALFIATIYIYIHAMLIYPALFNSSWLWAPLAGSPTFVTLFGLAGKIGVVAVALAMVNKRREAVGLWLKRWGWAAAAVAAVAVAALVVGRLAGRPALKNRGPNIILIGLDSIRPDHVHAFGYKRNTTPNLDRFMKDSVIFKNTFVPLARTGPSWMSILTGCFPPTHGHRCDMAPKESRIPPVETLAAHLKNLGYETSFFLDNTNFMWMDPELGFSHIDQPRPNVVWFGLSFFPLKLISFYYFLNNPVGFHYAPMLRNNEAFSSVYDPHYFARSVGRHIERLRGKEKFFLAAHTCIVHAPFCVRYPYSTYFSPPPPTPQNRFAFRWPFEQVLWKKELERRTNPKTLPLIFSQEINLYDTLVRETDDWLGEVLDSIRRAGLYDNSIIAVFSDHGEDLFRTDHPYPYLTSNHGFHVWGDDSYRITLAIKLPNSKYAGTVVPWLARSIDIAPTVLDAAGLPPLPKAEGVSLMPQIKNPSLDPRLVAYGEAGLSLKFWFIPGHRDYPFPHWVLFQYVEPETLRIYRKEKYMAGFVEAKDRFVRTSRWKLIAFPMKGDPVPYKTTLHDVERDPTNLVDLSTSYPAALDRMRSLMEPFIRQDAEHYGFQWRWADSATSGSETTSPTLSGGQ